MSDPQFIALYPYMAVYLESSDRALILRKIDDLLTYLSDTTESAVEWFYVDEDGFAWYRTSYEYLRAKYFGWISIAQFKRHIYYLRDIKVLKITSGWSQHQFKKEVWLAIDRKVLETITSTARGQSYQKDTTIVSKRYDPSIKMIPSTYHFDTIDVSKRYSESSDQNQESNLPIQSSSSSSNSDDSTTPEGRYDENSDQPDLHEIDLARVEAYEKNISTLEAYGVVGKKLIELSAKSHPEDVDRWIAYVESLPDAKIKTSRHSYLVAMLESGQPAPEPLDPGIRAKTAPRTGDYYTSGKYSDEVES